MTIVCETASLQEKAAASLSVFRISVLPQRKAFYDISDFYGLGLAQKVPTYWLQAEGLTPETAHAIATTILCDAVTETPEVFDVAAVSPSTAFEHFGYDTLIQKQFLPGVTDNLANSVRDVIALLFPALKNICVASGETVYLKASDALNHVSAQTQLASQYYNPLIETIDCWPISDAAPSALTHRLPLVTALPEVHVETIVLPEQDDDLMALSQLRHLALSLDEMRAIRDYYAQERVLAERQADALPASPTDVELEILAQTWSEHCKHKIFSATIQYEDHSFVEVTGVAETSEIHGLFKTCIVEPTVELAKKRGDLLSVFKDNAGVVQFDEDSAVCFKVETHNSPSALEPYGGALTGIVGVNRDILGTGMGAKPIFNTDVFCFAHPDVPHLKHERLLPPEAIVTGVRKGVEDGGNKSGIPTINGSLYFDARYRAKPLVYCGTGGVMPLALADGRKAYEKYTRAGDAIVMLGGRVGKDGIHGATFSSEALHEGSPVSAVQIGDPLTQKRLTDFLLKALSQGLFTGLTDNGAGGLSSSVGEMAEFTNGARLELADVPLKYPGLQPYEIVVSESQERMTLSTDQPEALLALAKTYQVEATVIGEFTDTGYFDIQYHGRLVAKLPLSFLHDGLPPMTLKAVWEPEKVEILFADPPETANEVLQDLLAHPNICSRESLIRHYDHEVQGRSVVKSLTGEKQLGPSDAAVIRPKLDSDRGLAVSNGLCPQFSDWDTYHMAACAVDEAIRNAVAVGADPATITLLDNFCWPDPVPSKRNYDAEHKMAQLVRACLALKDCAEVYETPFISGKDSMKNDFDDGRVRLSIPPTLLISAMGILPDVNKVVTMPFKQAGDLVYVLGETHRHMGGTHYYKVMGWQARFCPQVNPARAKRRYDSLFAAMQQGLLRSCHDLSEGGLAVALAECVIGSGLGANLKLDSIHNDSPELRWDDILFSETPSRFLVSIAPEHREAFETIMKPRTCLYLGEVTSDAQLRVMAPHRTNEPDWFTIDLDAQALEAAWSRSPLKEWPWERLS